MSELCAGPQLFEYFIANKFHKRACAPSRRLGSVLALLLELARSLGFSRVLWNCCHSNTCVCGRRLDSSGFCFLSFWKNWLPFLLHAGCWWAGHWKTHCTLQLFHRVPGVLYPGTVQATNVIYVFSNVVEKLFRGSGSRRDVNSIGWKKK